MFTRFCLQRLCVFFTYGRYIQPWFALMSLPRPTLSCSTSDVSAVLDSFCIHSGPSGQDVDLRDLIQARESKAFDSDYIRVIIVFCARSVPLIESISYHSTLHSP